jgi:hypothetical protein
MVEAGKWETKKFVVRGNTGKIMNANHYRPKPSCAVRSART